MSKGSEYVHGHYKFDFTAREWEEIDAMTTALGELNEHRAYTREQWVTIGHIALGKAQRIEEGVYDDITEEDGDSERWANELRDIAAAIFQFFQPGDGKL